MTRQTRQYLPDGYQSRTDGNLTIVEVEPSQLLSLVKALRARDLSLKLIDVSNEQSESRKYTVWYIFGVPKESGFIILSMGINKDDRFPTISSIYHSAVNYERKIATMFGLSATDNPDGRRLILHENWPTDLYPLRKDFAYNTKLPRTSGEYQFNKVDGEGIYEIPVGPVHAGIIEPGYFRFSVVGEEIILLEPRLGYTHKGSEKLFEQLPINEMVGLSEKISGDSSFSHSLAFCQTAETLSKTEPPKRAAYLRTIYAELERISNHLGDIGAIMLDTGYSFGGSQGARLREIVMRINERLSGSRFLRGCNVVGGVTKDLSEQKSHALADELRLLAKDFREVMDVAENSVSLINRLRGTGTVENSVALEYGALGLAARASGISTDARLDYPYAAYPEIKPRAITGDLNGDVLSRFRVRIQEVYTSIQIIETALSQLPDGPIVAPGLATERTFKSDCVALGVVEGWRGEILYFVKTNKMGAISRVALRDPSFINWQLLPHASFRQVVPDFPLINKSFNLSYSGHDL